jgi:hypothetical protein
MTKKRDDTGHAGEGVSHFDSSHPAVGESTYPSACPAGPLEGRLSSALDIVNTRPPALASQPAARPDSVGG